MTEMKYCVSLARFTPPPQRKRSKQKETKNTKQDENRVIDLFLTKKYMEEENQIRIQKTMDSRWKRETQNDRQEKERDKKNSK